MTPSWKARQKSPPWLGVRRTAATARVALVIATEVRPAVEAGSPKPMISPSAPRCQRGKGGGAAANSKPAVIAEPTSAPRTIASASKPATAKTTAATADAAQATISIRLTRRKSSRRQSRLRETAQAPASRNTGEIIISSSAVPAPKRGFPPGSARAGGGAGGTKPGGRGGG